MKNYRDRDSVLGRMTGLLDKDRGDFGGIQIGAGGALALDANISNLVGVK